MFGKIVMDVPADAFEHALDEAKAAKGPNTQDTDLDGDHDTVERCLEMASAFVAADEDTRDAAPPA